MTAKTEKLSITVPKEVAEMLKEYVPSGKVSSYVAEILEYALQMEKQRRGLEAGLGAWKDEDHPDLKTPEDTQRFIRSLRKTGHDRLKRVGAVSDDE